MGGPGGQSKGGPDSEGGVQSSFQVQAKSVQIPCDLEFLPEPRQKPTNVGFGKATATKTSYRISHKPEIPGVLQQVISGSQTKQQMEANLGFKHLKHLSEREQIQDGNPRVYKNLPTGRGVGHLNRLQGRLFPYPNSPPCTEIYEIPCKEANLPIQGTSIRASHSPHGIYSSCKGGQINGATEGYKNPPVPRRLVSKSHIPSNLSPAYPDPGVFVPGTGVGGQSGEIGTGTKTGFRFRRLPVRPPGSKGQTDPRSVVSYPVQNPGSSGQPYLLCQEVNVPDRPANSNREAGTFRSFAHETHSMAPQEQLEGPRITFQGHSNSKRSSSSSKVVAQIRKRTFRPAPTSFGTCPASLYRRLRRRLGRSLKQLYCKGLLEPSRKQVSHQLSRTESSLSGSQGVQTSLLKQGCLGGHRQHNCCCLHKQAGGDEVRLPLRPPVEDPDLVLEQQGHSKGQTHPREAQCHSRQVIPSGSDHPNRVVSPPRSFSRDLFQVAPTNGGPVCHQVQQQATTVCFSGSRRAGLGSGCLNPVLGKSGPICLPTSSHLGQSGGEATGLPLQQDDSNCTRVAQHALVLGSGGHVQSDPILPAQPSQLAGSAVQPDPSQESGKSESSCLAPRASTIKEQGFSEAVATRIEAPQRKSTRSVYEAKWTIFTKWCISNQVDIRSPSIKSIADFLLHLFEDRKLQPSTIDGYRSAIADKLGNSVVNVSKDENLTRLLDSFHRDRPKGRRGIPSWNLSLVMHQLTKAPFEPIREASLKHLTFKTVFLLALASGKRRSEIHAWLKKNIRHQTDWSNVSLYPSPSFLSKNQLAKEGPASVAPVVIPALAPTLDRSLKGDRSLCPVRALRYYLDKTSELRKNKELVFVSFKKGFTKDISPATISSWIKQTVILCYELSDQQAHTIHQVKAHDVRAFAASKAFQSGLSLEQILSACHWRSHNTFTEFYLKDVAWADSELFHLGPVVAAQQIHHQTL